MEEQIKEIREMLTCFTSVDDVCKSQRMAREQLDEFCKEHYDMDLSEAEEVFAAQGRARVHAAQVAAAVDGNNSMLLLLGKQYLGQTDEVAPPAQVKKETNPFEQIANKYANARDRKRKGRKSDTTN